MNVPSKPSSVSNETVLEAMPVGVAVIDADRRVVLINPAYCASLGMPANSFPPGTKLEDMLRTSAYRGVYGPGDPEAQVAALMAHDRLRPGRLRQRTYQGHSFDLYNAPLPLGGHVVCAVETTALLNAHDEAVGTLARVTASLATLRTGIAAFSSGRTLLFSNPRFAELLGMPPHLLRPGLPFADLLSVMAERDEFTGIQGETFLATQRDANRSEPSVLRRIRPNAQVIDVSSDPLPDGGWTITVTDVSPLARAEDEERRRATLLRSILDAIPHGVCVYSAERRVTMFNQAYSELMRGAPVAIGDSLEEVVRRRTATGEYGEVDPAEIFAQQMAFNVSLPQMRKRRRPNGMMVDVRTSPLPDGGYISVVTNITSLTEAETEASRRAEELAIMLSCIRHGVLLWGPDRRLLASNAIATELLHHPPGLLTPGRSQDEILASMIQRGHFGDGEGAHQAAQELARRSRTAPYLRQVTTIAGRILDVRSDPTPGGGWVSTFTDVTEARTAEEELRRAKEAAEAASQAKSRFLAAMSHELRTPLNLIIGFSDALLHEAEKPSHARVVEFAEQINDAGRDLLNLINVILDVARIETGRFDLAADKVDIARLVRHCMRQAEVAAQTAGVTLASDVADSGPLIRADERRLQQVLHHLLSNAIKFSHAGGSVSVSVTASPASGMTLIVRDSGIGIPAEELERVFEPFTQVDSGLARQFPGAGLGLYLSRALIAGHGGELRLHSASGKGTTVEIQLPAALLLPPGEVSATGGQP
jgi:signal transduction histidine kinase